MFVRCAVLCFFILCTALLLLLMHSHLLSSGRLVKPHLRSPGDCHTAVFVSSQRHLTPNGRAGRLLGNGLEQNCAPRPQLLCFLIKMTAARSLFLPESSPSRWLTDSV